MTASSTQALVLGKLTEFGVSVLAILGGVIVIGLGYLVFRFGWRKIKGSLS